MILVVKERIPAEISLCKRRDLLIHISAQSIEPPPEITTISPECPSYFLSPHSLPLVHVSLVLSKLPPCREQWRCGKMARDSSRLPSFQPSEGIITAIPDKAFLLMVSITFQRRTVTGLDWVPSHPWANHRDQEKRILWMARLESCPLPSLSARRQFKDGQPHQNSLEWVKLGQVKQRVSMNLPFSTSLPWGIILSAT